MRQPPRNYLSATAFWAIVTGVLAAFVALASAVGSYHDELEPPVRCTDAAGGSCPADPRSWFERNADVSVFGLACAVLCLGLCVAQYVQHRRARLRPALDYLSAGRHPAPVRPENPPR